VKNVRTVLLCFLVVPSLVSAQSPTQSVDVGSLKSQVAAQQKMLDQQQQQIQALQAAMSEQRKMLQTMTQSGGNANAAALEQSVQDLQKSATDLKTNESQWTPPSNQPLSSQAEKVEEELQRGPEIADVTPDTPAIPLGPAKIRLIGYPALTSVFRSNSGGGNVGTSFGGIPFSNTVAGNTSEFRLSAQSTRLAIRADADLRNSRVAGYFEMDFGGQVPGNVAVSSTSYGFRIRQAWFDYSNGKFEFTAGQLFSLMTPSRQNILPWPGDLSASQVLDTNYLAGTVWARYPQVRFVYHLSSAASLGFSMENPEQTACGVTFPSELAPTLGTQYDNCSGSSGPGLSIPNLTPDFIFKASFDSKLGGKAFHLDTAGLLRVFRNYDPTGSNPVSGHEYAIGGGGNVDASLQLTGKVRYIIQAYGSSGGGRYIGGLIPDVVVQSNGSITPVPAYAWTSGFEIAPDKNAGYYIYYSGNYGERETVLDTATGKLVGWGFPGASNGADRYIQEATGGYSRVVWKGENLGSVQIGIQYGYVWLSPWSAAGGPSQAHTNMVFGQTRYNLP
jgi:hypothetical protein